MTALATQLLRPHTTPAADRARLLADLPCLESTTLVATETVISGASRTSLGPFYPSQLTACDRDTSGRTQASRFATNSRESEAAARKLVGSMKKDAKGWLVEQKRKTRPTFDFTFAPQALPTAVEPEEIDEIEDADDDVSRGVRSIDLELERRNKVESSRILSRLEAMDREYFRLFTLGSSQFGLFITASSTAATRRALLAKSDWVGTRSRLTTSSSRPKQPVNLTKSALRPSRVPYSAPDINPPPSSLPSFPADHRRPTPDSLQVAYRSPSPSPPPQPPQRSEFAQSFYDAQAMAEDYPAQRGDFEADEGGGCFDEFGYEMNDVQGGSDYGEYTREQRNDRSWEREDTQEFDYTPSDSDSILDFPDEDHHSMDVAYSRPSSPQLVYEHDRPPCLAVDPPPIPVAASRSDASDASFVSLPRRSRHPPLAPPLEPSRFLTSEKYYSNLAESMGMILEPSFFAPRWVDWTGPCCVTREQRASLADAFIFTTYEAEDEVGMQWEPTREEEKVLGERMGLGCTGGTREQMGRWEEGMVGRWEKEWASDWDYETVPDEGWAGILARSRGDDASAEEQGTLNCPGFLPHRTSDCSLEDTVSLERPPCSDTRFFEPSHHSLPHQLSRLALTSSHPSRRLTSSHHPLFYLTGAASSRNEP